MARNAQEPAPFDNSERVYIERPAEICFVSLDGAPISVFVEVWDINQRTLAWTPNAGGSVQGAIQLSVTSVAASLAYLAKQTYNAVQPPNQQPGVANPIAAGLPIGTVGGCFIVDPTATAGRGIVVNTAGTPDGADGAGNGITSGRAGPVFFGPRIVLVGYPPVFFGGFAL